MAPKFLSFAEVIEIHQDQLARYGGDPGIRDLNGLKSALGTPAATFGGEFLHPDICTMAAAYLFHITGNHPLVDGNKRTGTVAALVFLDLNGYEFNAPEDELTDAVMAVASGQSGKDEVTEFFRKWTRRKE
ncbi:MAG: type II toxin-antitoxin system death-on-curing family toxin [bacterium]|nr:type II toxin-antitoxin system death-on-curing family toxin [bacterium]MDT8365794.1 type II toxin-antitoxin system death-on-curing family toxin [bacterium]